MPNATDSGGAPKNRRQITSFFASRTVVDQPVTNFRICNFLKSLLCLSDDDEVDDMEPPHEESEMLLKGSEKKELEPAVKNEEKEAVILKPDESEKNIIQFTSLPAAYQNRCLKFFQQDSARKMAKTCKNLQQQCYRRDDVQNTVIVKTWQRKNSIDVVFESKRYADQFEYHFADTLKEDFLNERDDFYYNHERMVVMNLCGNPDYGEKLEDFVANFLNPNKIEWVYILCHIKMSFRFMEKLYQRCPKARMIKFLLLKNRDDGLGESADVVNAVQKWIDDNHLRMTFIISANNKKTCISPTK